MAPKASTKKTSKSKASAKTPQVKKITAPAKKSAATKKTPTKAEETKAKSKLLDQEAVSLIDEEGNKKKPAAKPVTKKVVPRKISRTGSEPAVESKPEPAPVVPPTPEPEDEETEEEGNVIHLKPPVSVKDLSKRMNIKPFQMISDLMEMEIFASINHTLEPDIIDKLCEKHGFVFEREKRAKGGGVRKPEPVVEPPPEPEPVADEEMSPRAPIVTFMGHVDHGKTSLLDYIRNSRVAKKEAGGITQHIGAYSVEHDKKKITFLDTPGHQAFTAMRARGANITDIVVVVVAADDGIMPQTKEALSHAKAAGVKIMIAINKIDVKNANVDQVKSQLQEAGYTPEDWGGETICCEVSAIKGTGVDNLLEMIQLESELLELKASEDVDARGSVIEAQIEPGRGPTASIVVQMGVMKNGQAFLCGNQSGKIKSLINDQGKQIKEAGPSTPVKVLGFNALPNSGDEFVVMASEKDARVLSEERLDEARKEKLAKPQRATLETLLQDGDGTQAKTLQLVLKTDVQGSLEAITESLKEIESEKIEVNILHSAVGPVTESDVLLASASDAIAIGFGVKVDSGAVAAAKREGIEIKLYSIIYELLDQVKDAMTGMLDPETRENVIGHAEVKQVFSMTKGKVAGCMVTDGRIQRTARARVLRGRQPVYDGALATLRRFQDEVKEVRAGLECGIKLGNFNDYEVKDVIECYLLENVEQSL